jgi:hypothetical protein
VDDVEIFLCGSDLFQQRYHGMTPYIRLGIKSLKRCSKVLGKLIEARELLIDLLG